MDFFASLDLRGQKLTRSFLQRTLPRPEVDVTAAMETVQPVIDAVRDSGAPAVLDYTEKFDGFRPKALRVPAKKLSKALKSLDPEIRSALEVAIERVRAVDEAQLPEDSTIEVTSGGIVKQRWLPLERVGLYVPGGRAVLPSSVIMNAVPAQVAGVKELVVVSPPQQEFDGLPHPTILAACELLGVSEVYAAGGAQAIAMLAFGDQDELEPVDMITGPGNVYVAAAKRAVQGTVGIDAEAGPTEIAIVADLSASPALVAADLISQSEHDPMAASVLITDSEKLVVEVREELNSQAASARHLDRITKSLQGPQSRAILVDDMDAAITVANAYGAEHLEIQTRTPAEHAARITNAGAIFVGENSPVSLGDYAAGSNHVLPTGGSSRFSSGLSVHTYLRVVRQISYTHAALAQSRAAAETLAAAEDLPAHGRAIAIRFS